MLVQNERNLKKYLHITHKQGQAVIVVILLLAKLIGLTSVLKAKYQALYKRLWVILLYVSLEIN